MQLVKVEDVCYYSWCSLTKVCWHPVLNRIPLATLAAYYLVGYKLANPKTIIHFWKKIKYQFAYLLLL
jgi:MFS superfamily sulfate permease-like transporter